MSEAARSRFLEGVLRQLEAFALVAVIEPREVVVRSTLVDGTVVVSRGLVVSGTPNGWGLVGSLGEDRTEALVMRESSVVEVELAPSAIADRPPIGFIAESRG